MGIKTRALSFLSKGKFFAVAHTPEICMIAGTIELGLTIYSACKGAIKFQAVLAEHNARLEALDIMKAKIENGESVDIPVGEEIVSFKSLEDIKLARQSTYRDTFKGFLGCFWKTGLFALGTAGTFGFAIHTVNKRLIDAVAIGSAALTKNKQLEDHILKNEGPDKLAEALGCEKAEVLESHIDPETGETVVDAVRYSGVKPMFSVEFDERNGSFEKRRPRFYDTTNGDYTPNLTYLTAQNNFLDFKLEQNRHMFANEALKILDYPDEELFEDGWTYGWKWKEGGNNHIDIGLYSPINKAFLEGKSDYCTLVLNVDPEPIIGAIGYRKAHA